MTQIGKRLSESGDQGSPAEWYLTVRCTNGACMRLIAFQKAVYRGNHSNLGLAVTGEPSVDCPYCGTQVRFSMEQIERRKVTLTPT
jgi:hypothetical protein